MSGTSSPSGRTLVDCVAITPLPSTPRQGGKCRAYQSVSLTPTMASRFQKKLRPTRRRNYKVSSFREVQDVAYAVSGRGSRGYDGGCRQTGFGYGRE